MMWPMPRSYTNGSTTATMSSKGSFVWSGIAAVPTLAAAATRYSALMFNHAGLATVGAITGLTVQVADHSEAPPQLDTDESYVLDIPSAGRVTLSAASVYGALRGFETLSQVHARAVLCS